MEKCAFCDIAADRYCDICEGPLCDDHDRGTVSDECSLCAGCKDEKIEESGKAYFAELKWEEIQMLKYSCVNQTINGLLDFFNNYYYGMASEEINRYIDKEKPDLRYEWQKLMRKHGTTTDAGTLLAVDINKYIRYLDLTKGLKIR